MAAFRYAPLDRTRNEIRLLELNGAEATLVHYSLGRDREEASGGKPHDNDDIDLTPRHDSTSNVPNFAAVSYVWGTSPPTRWIRIDGARFAIRPTLRRFLDRLQAREFMTRLWIDSICIDQQDDAEKSHQIGLMKRIFTTAERVCVWLGEPGGGTSEEQIRSALGQMNAFVNAGGYVDVVRPEMMGLLTQLAALPYWGRIWMVQEVVLARRLDVLWGGVRFDGSLLEMLNEVGRPADDPLMARMERAMPPRRRDVLDLLAGSKMGRLLHLRQVLQLERHVDAEFYFRRLWLLVLLYVGSSAATVPHDKVYGLLGLVQERIMVDYSKPLADVYRDAIRTMPVRDQADFAVVTGRWSRATISWRLLSRDCCPVAGEDVFLFYKRSVITLDEVLSWILDGENERGGSFLAAVIFRGTTFPARYRVQ